EDTKEEFEAKSEKDFYSMEELESLDDESVAYLAKRYSNLKFQRAKGARKFTPKQSGGTKTLIDKSKIKCYKCNVLGHFANECRSKELGKGKGKEEDIAYYKKKYFDLLNSKKTGKAYIAEGDDWADSDDDEERVEYTNLALMANSTSSGESNEQVSLDISPDISKTECVSTIKEMSNEIRDLYNTLKSALTETERLQRVNEEITKINNLLEVKVADFQHLENEVARLENKLDYALKREQWFKDMYEKEKNITNDWLKSSHIVHTESSNVQKQFKQKEFSNKNGIGYKTYALEESKKVRALNDIFCKPVGKSTVEIVNEAIAPKETPESSKGKEKLECLQINEEHDSNSDGKSESGRTELSGGCSLYGITKDIKNTLSHLASRKACWNCSSTTHLSFQCKNKTKIVKNDKVLVKSLLNSKPIKKVNLEAPKPRRESRLSMPKIKIDLHPDNFKVNIHPDISRTVAKSKVSKLVWVPKKD
ncbi:MAG: hypothetical protein E6L02_08070, partial [Thaumarchaeota archaeon]